MKIYSLITCIAIVLFLLSCEEQMIPIPEPPTPGEGRVLLIEDYTGVNCVPCYNANILVSAVIEENPESVVALGIHGDLQSEPVTGSKYDFRYEDPFEWEINSGLQGKPAASFNRITLPGGSKVKSNVNTWQPIIDAELQKEQVVEIKAISTYDAATRRASIDISVIPLVDIPGDVLLHAVISESDLIDSQNSTIPPPDNIILDYKHKHVMKKSLTGLNGALVDSDLVTEEIYRDRYDYTIPPEDNAEWIPEHMEVTVFVTSVEQDNEVLQAVQIKLLQ